MRVEEQIRDLVIGELDAIDIGGLADSGTIRTQAAKRDRRRRVTGGLATLLIACVVAIGAGGLFGDDTPSAVFAGLEDVELQPTSAVHDGERYVGLAPTEPLDWPVSASSYVVVTSANGRQWQAVEELGELHAQTAMITRHDGVFHIVGTRRVAPDSETGEDDSAERHELVHRWTANLKDFDELIQPNPVGDDRMHFWLQEVVASDAGVAVSVQSLPDFDDVYTAALDEIGVVPDDLCESATFGRSLRVRLCGETARQILTLDEPVPETLPEPRVLFARPGQEFSFVPEPESDGGRFAIWRQQQIYSTGSGIGISGVKVRETTDGETWSVVDTGEDETVLMAARGADRVFRTSQPVAYFGPDDPLLGMAMSKDGGPWERVDLSSAYEDPDVSFLFFSGIYATDSGWLLVAQRQTRDDEVNPEVLGVESGGSSRLSDFVLTSVDGYELTGQTPFGPAVLTNPEGQTVREWDQLEVFKPTWSGFEVEDESVRLVDSANNDEVVFTHQQWRAIANHSYPEGSVFDVLTSEDGRSWQVAHSSPDSYQIIAAGNDQLLIQNYGPYQHRTNPIRTLGIIDLATSD